MKGNFMTSFGKLNSVNQMQICLRIVLPAHMFFGLAVGSK